MKQHDIRSMNLPELETLMAEMNAPPYRASQIFSWIHQKNMEDFPSMSNLPKAFREQLNELCYFSSFEIAGKCASDADGTIKYLFALEKDTIMEAVLMRYAHGYTLCVSTQAGCRMGCRFCASTVGGLQRDLTAGEMCAQVYAARRDAGVRIDGIVMMGCGEPLDNFDQSIRFISLISHPKGQSIGRRHITLSTCGLVPPIRKLADLKWPITLAVSLHAPNDIVRQRIMPVARRYSVKETLDACDYYVACTGRRVTVEYAMIGGVNDSADCAGELARLLKGKLYHVNLIPVNQTSHDIKPSERIEPFARVLTRNGVPVTVRRSTGGDIQAACGQLRARVLNLQSD